MKYRKLIENILSQKSNRNTAQVAVALVAGLAAGAVISILLAPDKGANTRKSIAGKARTLGGTIRNSYATLKDNVLGSEVIEELPVTNEMPHFTHKVTKKAKSDIKSIIDDAHKQAAHTEQSLN